MIRTLTKRNTVFGVKLRAAAALAAILCAAAGAGAQTTQPFDLSSIYGRVTTQYTGAQVRSWRKIRLDGKECLVSPRLDFGADCEVNHHRVAAVYSGTGSLEVSVAHSTSPILLTVLQKKYLRSRFLRLKSKTTIKVSSNYKRERYVWLFVRTSGQVTIKALGHACWRGKGTIYGHMGRYFEFASGKLPYRLMYPRRYDPQKSYPLVISVSGSGGVGMDNARSMEMIVFARFLFTRYYNDREFECFSVVPQIPPPGGQVPAPYYPKGPRGRPTPPFHPDWPAVNENGWYTQATLALTEELLKAPSINIDPDRIYFAGYSYGGKACWEFLRAGRDVFAAAASGGGWPIGRARSKPTDILLRRLKLEVRRYRHIPTYIFAGSRDAMRFGSEAVHKEILVQGGKSFYDEIPGATHVGAAARGWTNRKRISWLFRQRRSKNPRAGKDPFPGGIYDRQ